MPLHCSVEQGKVDAGWLLDRGADKTVINDMGMTPRDPAKALNEEALFKLLGRTAMREVNRRREEMLIDKCNMYNLARMAPNPALGPSCPGSWMGHGQQIVNWQNRLKRLISQAIANNCYLPNGAFDAAYGGLPRMPRGY